MGQFENRKESIDIRVLFGSLRKTEEFCGTLNNPHQTHPMDPTFHSSGETSTHATPGSSSFQTSTDQTTQAPYTAGNHTEFLFQTLIQLQQQNQILFQQGQQALQDHQTMVQRIDNTLDGNRHAIRDLGDSFNNVSLALREPKATRTQGPKVKDPSTYDGDRSGDKLDTHIRELRDWFQFYRTRNVWSDETEAVQLAQTFLSNSIRQLFEATAADETRTMDSYLKWLNNCFRDSNEQTKYRNHWAQMVQGQQSIMDFVADLVKLGAKIIPAKTSQEIKEALRIGMDSRIYAKMVEHPEWDDLPLGDYVQRADRAEETLRLAREHRGESTFREPPASRFYSILKPRNGRDGPAPFRKRPEKGTDAWKTWCRTARACFECGKKGHPAERCYQRGNNRSPRGRSPTPMGRRSTGRERSNSFQARNSSRSRSDQREKAVAFETGN